MLFVVNSMLSARWVLIGSCNYTVRETREEEGGRRVRLERKAKLRYIYNNKGQQGEMGWTKSNEWRESDENSKEGNKAKGGCKERMMIGERRTNGVTEKRRIHRSVSLLVHASRNNIDYRPF